MRSIAQETKRAQSAARGTDPALPDSLSTSVPASFSDSARLPRDVGIGALLLLLAYLPAWLSYGADLWRRQHYQFFPLALVGAALLARRGWQTPPVSATSPARGAMAVFVVLAFGLLAASTWLASAWLGVVSSLVLAVGVLLGWGGRARLRLMTPALLMLVLLVRPPLQWDGELVFWLRQFAVRTSSHLLDALGVPHFLTGNVVEIPTKSLLVDEACSGINSAFFVLALSLFYGLWRRRRPARILLVVLASVSFVLLGNVLRIGGGGLLQYRYGIDVLTGWPHEAAGLALFAGYVGLMVSMDELAARLFTFFRPAPAAAANRSAPPLTGEPSSLATLVRAAAGSPPSPWVLRAGVLFALFGLAQGGLGLTGNRQAWSGFAVSSPNSLNAGDNFALPEKLAQWERLPQSGSEPVVRESVLAGKTIYSRVWAYAQGPLEALVSFDFPYLVEHDLTICYRGIGWDIGERAAHKDTTDEYTPFWEVQMSRKPLGKGYLWHTAFDRDGRWFEGFSGRLEARFRGVVGPVYQVQVLVTSEIPLTEADRERVRQLFLEVRRRFVGQVRAQPQVKP